MSFLQINQICPAQDILMYYDNNNKGIKDDKDNGWYIFLSPNHEKTLQQKINLQYTKLEENVDYETYDGKSY